VEILLIEKVAINLHIAHEYHHKQLRVGIAQEILVAPLLFFVHFGLDI